MTKQIIRIHKIKNQIPARTAGIILFIFLGLLAVFHILVLLKAVPSTIVWGGQISNSRSNLFIMELISLMVTLLFASIVMIKIGLLRMLRNKKLINAGIWIIFTYFILNTVMNFASSVSIENYLLAPLTIIMAFLALRLALE